jgi:hypothetical protein
MFAYLCEEKLRASVKAIFKKPQFIGKIISYQWVEPNNNTDKRKLNILFRKVSLFKLQKLEKKNSIYDFLIHFFQFGTTLQVTVCNEGCLEYVN